MKHLRYLLIPAALLIFLIAGCYTQMYRPDMESASRQRQQATLYNRDDSTAIDTTLAPDTTGYYETYPEYGWNDWGRPRHRPIWGWDFNYNYMPDYYWGYYGYDNYYGVPWWNNWYDPYYPYYPGGGGGYSPGEPPSKRGGGRSHDTGGGSYVAPPPAPGGSPSYVTPSPPPSTPPPQNGAKKDDGKRSGGRGR